MTVYVINNMTIHDRNEYDKYVQGFMPVFQKYRGTILAVHDAPSALEGSWPYDRTVLLSFPSREDLERFYQSAEYQEIARHRRAGTVSNAVVIDGMPSRT